MADTVKVPVIEIGAWYTKCGFAGDGAPKHIVFKNMPQKAFKPQMVPTGAPRPYYDGLGLVESGKALDADVKASRAAVPKSKDDWRPLIRPHLDEIFFQLLLCDPKDKQVIIVEDMLAPSSFRHAWAPAVLPTLCCAALPYSCRAPLGSKRLTAPPPPPQASRGRDSLQGPAGRVCALLPWQRPGALALRHPDRHRVRARGGGGPDRPDLRWRAYSGRVPPPSPRTHTPVTGPSDVPGCCCRCRLLTGLGAAGT